VGYPTLTIAVVKYKVVYNKEYMYVGNGYAK